MLIQYMHANIVVTNPKWWTHSSTLWLSPSYYRHVVKSPDLNMRVHMWGRTGSGISEMLLAAAERAISGCDVCSKCSSLYLFQLTHKYFQHQGIFSTSHWWTAPIHISSFLFFYKGCIGRATTGGLCCLIFKIHPVLLVNLLGMWWAEMTTSFPCITHGWLCWGFADILGQHAEAQREGE